MNSEGDNTTKTDPFFAKICQFLFQRNVLRVAVVLVFYNAIIEVVKGNMSNDNIASAYYGNAIGALCLAWLYGWGYYINQGSFYKAYLLEGDDNRKNRMVMIKNILECIVKGNNNIEYNEDDIKWLLEEAYELGVSSFDEPIIECAIRHDFKSRNVNYDPVSFLPDLKTYFCNKEEESKKAAKIGYYELLGIAGKYLTQQRLYGKKDRNRFIEMFLIVAFIIDFFIVAVLGLYYYWDNWYSCYKTGEPLTAAYNCNAVDFGMKFQLGYILFAANLWLNLAGVIVTLD